MSENLARKAIEALDKYGWHKGNWQGMDGSVCGYGAIRMSAYNGGFFNTMCGDFEASRLADEQVHQAHRIASKIALEQFPERFALVGGQRLRGFAIFNDHENTTLDEVILVLEKTAIKLDEECH